MRKKYQILMVVLLILFLFGCTQEGEEDEYNDDGSGQEFAHENETEHDAVVGESGEPAEPIDVDADITEDEVELGYLGEEIWAVYASIFDDERLLAFRSYQGREMEKTENSLHWQVMIEGRESNTGVLVSLDKIIESIHARQILLSEQQATMAEIILQIQRIEDYLIRMEESPFRENVLQLQRLFQERYKAFSVYNEHYQEATQFELSLYTALREEFQDLQVVNNYIAAITEAYTNSQVALQDVYEISNQIGEIKHIFSGIAEGEIMMPYNFAQEIAIVREKDAIMEFNGQIRRIAYLTFDDGPSNYLPKILDILAEYDVQATFFMIGVNLANPNTHDYVRRAVAEGHYVGAHSMTHIYSRIFEQGYGVSEMLEAIDLIEEITGTRPILVRFPFGTAPGMTEYLASQVQAAGLRVWDWTVDSLDWRDNETAESILERTKEQIFRDREVILLHELSITVEILPDLIEYLLEQGYLIKAYDEDFHFPVNQIGNPNL